MSRETRAWAIGPDASLNLGPRTLVMGIVNATPDSFFDGGRHASRTSALDHALALAGEGADIIDLGGESTRPGSGGTSLEEELERTVPVIEAFTVRSPVLVSIDTKKAAVAAAALAAGASIINDISGLSADPEMIPLAARTRAGVVMMHMRGSPADMQTRCDYQDLLAEIAAEMKDMAGAALAGGVAREAIVLDPGVGFAKTPDQNLALMRGLPRLADLGYPLLIGASRKSFIGHSLAAAGLPDAPDMRLEGSLAAAALAAWLGGDIVRVHDVTGTRKAVAVIDSIREARFVGRED